jgi:hypothetical protein
MASSVRTVIPSALAASCFPSRWRERQSFNCWPMLIMTVKRHNWTHSGSNCVFTTSPIGQPVAKPTWTCPLIHRQIRPQNEGKPANSSGVERSGGRQTAALFLQSASGRYTNCQRRDPFVTASGGADEEISCSESRRGHRPSDFTMLRWVRK